MVWGGKLVGPRSKTLHRVNQESDKQLIEEAGGQ
jgi:hypothetical protein